MCTYEEDQAKIQASSQAARLGDTGDKDELSITYNDRNSKSVFARDKYEFCSAPAELASGCTKRARVISTKQRSSSRGQQPRQDFTILKHTWRQ